MKTNDEIYNEIKSKFDDCPELPERLKKENIVSMLKNTEPEKVKRISFTKIGYAAAIFAVVLLSLLTVNIAFGDGIKVTLNDKVTTEQLTEINSASNPNTSTALATQQEFSGELRKATSREEIEKIIINKYKKDKSDYAYDMNTSVTEASNFSSVLGAGEKNYYDINQSFSETNTQTSGVDEADNVKNDGRYLYVAGCDFNNNTKLRIIDTETMTAVYNSYLYNNNGDILDIREMYLTGNTLIAICSYGNDYYGSCCYHSNYSVNTSQVVNIVMDITDRAKPKIIRKNEQDGIYISSRMVGSVLYTVTQYTVSGKDEKDAEKNCLPSINGQDIFYDCIYIMNDNSLRYICLSAYDTADKKSEVSSLAVLGDGNDVYCSKNNLYIVGVKYMTEDSDSVLNIISFSLKGTDIALKAQGEVKGNIKNNYSLDEYEGNLRIATTTYSQKNVCSLYVLNSKLKVIGKLENIAYDESIKSVRYMGNMAYVVTYKDTDLLFVIDLKDPTKPKITGELKLPGYSEYLHPISENIILGIGYDGNSIQADLSSMKVSLFDVSDISKPKEISTFAVDNTYCQVIDNPKAFIYNEEESYIALPVEFYDYGIVGYGCYVISLKDNSLKVKYVFEHSIVSDVYAERFIKGAYIGDSFFTISDNSVVKYSLKNGKKQGECKIYTDTTNQTTSSYDTAVTVPPYIPTTIAD